MLVQFEMNEEQFEHWRNIHSPIRAVDGVMKKQLISDEDTIAVIAKTITGRADNDMQSAVDVEIKKKTFEEKKAFLNKDKEEK